jgi:hypothetical protein
MDSARHEQVVEAFFKCHPQAISDIFREFLLAMSLPGQPGTTSFTDTNTAGASLFSYRAGVGQ